MQRAERRSAEREGRAVRTLSESDYLLGVADETRLGALRFRWVGDEVFQAPIQTGVPAIIELGRLVQITERILRDEETDEDLSAHFCTRILARWCLTESLCRRSTWPSVHSQVPEGNRRIQHRDLGGGRTQAG